jgi:hypothetical protein
MPTGTATHAGPHHTDAYDEPQFTSLPNCYGCVTTAPEPPPFLAAQVAQHLEQSLVLDRGLASACFSYSRTATRCRWGYR